MKLWHVLFYSILALASLVTFLVVLDLMYLSSPLDFPTVKVPPSKPIQIRGKKGMEALKLSKIWNQKETVPLGKSIVCWNVAHLPDSLGLRSCYVENACISDGSPTFNVWLRENISDSVDVLSVYLNLRFSIRSQSSNLSYNFSTSNPNVKSSKASITFIMSRFEPFNLYHDTMDLKLSIFSDLVRLGYYDFSSLTMDLDSEAINVSNNQNFPFDETFKYFIGQVRDHTKSKEFTKNQVYCSPRMMIATPFFFAADFRSVYEPPKFINTSNNGERMVGSRHIMSYIIDDIFPGFRKSLVEFWLQHLTTDFFQQDYSDQGILASLFIASFERKTIWPALPSFFKKILPNIDLINHNGTHMTIVRRRTRNIINHDEMVAYFRKTMSHTPYSIIDLDMETLPLKHQLLIASRTTVFTGPHGAGLTLAAFSHPGTVIFDIQPEGKHNWHFARVAADFGHFFLFHVTNIRPLENNYNFRMPFTVQPEVICNNLKLSLWISDQMFGCPKSNDHCISDKEAFELALNSQGVIKYKNWKNFI